MYKFFQRNTKKILAILGVFLMIAFIIPSSAKTGSSSSHGPAVGKLGKTTVYSDETQAARNEWRLLTQLGRSGQGLVINRIGLIYLEILKNPDLFYLLPKEAELSGVRVSDDVVNTVITNQLPDSQFLSRDREGLFNAVKHLLEIGALHDRLASSVKISEPMLLRTNAVQWQSVILNLVSFGATEALASTTAPTTQQVEEQFSQFKSVSADTTNRAADPLGFGYQVPNRAKIQYMTVDRKQVAQAVRAGKSAFDWEVASKIYYFEHLQEFNRMPPTTLPTTLPATLPATTLPSAATTQFSTILAQLPATLPTLALTQPATLPVLAATLPATTLPAVAAGPSTRPYAEVSEEILDKLIAPDADKLNADITAAIKVRLDAGWQTFQSGTTPTTQPSSVASTLPTTQPAPYDSYAFLESVAVDIQKLFNVLPAVHQIGEWEDAKQLAAEPGIGSAQTADAHLFPKYATEEAVSFNPTTQPSAGQLHLLQPSQWLTDSAKSSYVFRLTAASPAHSPELKDMYARVEEDARTKAAYATALADARKLLEVAQKQDLTSAAVAGHRSITSTGKFRLNQQQPVIPNFNSSTDAVTALIGKARALLEEATPDHPHPVALVEMPSDRKVVVVELANVSLDASDSQLFRDKLMAMEQEQANEVEALAQKWFSYAAVAARLKYVPEKAINPVPGDSSPPGPMDFAE